ncbi:MAG: FkbM family methyltransferase [Isosphaeraceae bacterium]
MKRLIVNTLVGRAALSVREAFGRTYSALANPEAAGIVANDHLASFLTVRLCKSSGTFVDIGAHIGSVLAEVSRRCPSARIVAIEAMPDKADRLRRSFPHVEVHACALSDHTGEASFYVNTKLSGYSSLGRPPGRGGEVSEIKVPLKKLDDILAPGGVDLIKIDVEGAELGVLRGGERVIAEGRPTVMFESGPQADDGLGFSKEDLWRWLAARDYVVLVPNRVAHDGPGLSLDGFLESHLYPRRTTNYFAVASERRTEVRDRAREALGIRTTARDL